ncbi:MAG TPA: DUF1015 domain-containing protein [Acidimicrobiia bacterium]|nr:DUF1015 domain-containing protein [Acidimicrobiia bacterium]
MADLSPFAGSRYTGINHASPSTELAALVAPPYDVIDDDQRAALEAADEHNSVRLILPQDVAHDGDRYARAADTFTGWLTSGVLVADPQPRLYAYRMEFTDPHGARRHTRGVLGALTLPEPGDDDVLPHERTLPKAKSDRLALLRAMRVNVDPIWGLTLGSGLTPLLDGATPLAECLDPDGVLHEIAAIDDPGTIDAIRRVVGSAPLVLADGHHRFETALNYRNELRADGVDPAGAAAIMTFVVELVDDELCIEPIHRLVDTPAGTDIRARLADAFEIRDAGANKPENVDALEAAMHAEHALGLVDDRGLALAIPRADARAAALAGEHPAVAATDAAVIETMVVPRLPDATWQYRHDAQGVAALVDKGAATAAILCSPVSVANTRSAAVDRVRMPQKTTFFWPKPRTGMVFRPLD